MRRITVLLKDRQWWWPLSLMTSEQREATITKLFRGGHITDWQLWDILSLHNSPVSHAEATEIYEALGFVPHVGYPLTQNLAEEKANELVENAGPYEFVLLDWLSLMSHAGFSREEAAKQFRRLQQEGRIVHSGQCGLAFTYKKGEA